MFQREQAVLGREVEAIQIPDGTTTRLEEGLPVLITQELGGSYTVMTGYGAMFRIDARNADALGKEATEPGADEREDASAPLEDRVWKRLRSCYDPEIPVNIVDLGLVYDLRIDEEAEGEKAAVHVKMTLTAPGCGMGPVLAQDVKDRVEELPDVAHADVEVVLDPPWNQNMMSEAARLQLGFM